MGKNNLVNVWGESFKKGLLVWSFALVSLSVGCNEETYYERLPASGGGGGGGEQFVPGKAVCDPFGGNDQVNANSGLFGKLYYLEANQPRYTQVDSYLSNGVLADLRIFLSEVNVPTRAFDQGFISINGEQLKNAAGDPLFEYFAVDLKSELVLSQNDSEGMYQFAVLSDDGAILYLDSDGQGYQSLITSDGDHSSKLACASSVVNLSYSSRVPLRLKYYQGPRTHIALMLLWRKINVGGSLADSACGQVGNDTFFNSSFVPSQPKQLYLDLLNRGWKVVGKDNFMLPSNVAANPCAD